MFFFGNIVVGLAKAPVIEPYSKKVLHLQMLGITSEIVHRGLSFSSSIISLSRHEQMCLMRLRLIFSFLCLSFSKYSNYIIKFV